MVAVLLNDKPRASDVLVDHAGAQSPGRAHAKLLYSRMGEVTADDGSVLPIAGDLRRCPVADGGCGDCARRRRCSP